MNTKFAAMYLLAQKIREESYDRVAADKAWKDTKAKLSAKPEDMYASIGVDYSKFYRKTIDWTKHRAITNGGAPFDLIRNSYKLLRIQNEI